MMPLRTITRPEAGEHQGAGGRDRYAFFRLAFQENQLDIMKPTPASMNHLKLGLELPRVRPSVINIKPSGKNTLVLLDKLDLSFCLIIIIYPGTPICLRRMVPLFYGSNLMS